MNKLILILFCIFILSVTPPFPFPAFSPSPSGIYHANYININFFQTFYVAPNYYSSMTFFSIYFLVFLALFKTAQQIVASVIFVPFNANLNLLKKNKVHESFQFLFLFFVIPATDVMTYTDIFYFLFHCDLLLRFLSKFFFYASHFLLQRSLSNYSHVCLYVLCLSLKICVGFHLCHFCYTNCLPIILTILNLPNLFLSYQHGLHVFL